MKRIALCERRRPTRARAHCFNHKHNLIVVSSRIAFTCCAGIAHKQRDLLTIQCRVISY